jgi:hypothetical protein
MNDKKDMNRDPITGEPGSHPVGTGVGSAGGAAAGAAIGAMAGPIGAVVGGAIGAVAGGAAGHAAGEAVDPTAETAYWKANHSSRPYVDKGASWNDYEPAYRYGVQSRQTHAGRKFDDVENELSSGWQSAKGKSQLEWDRAKLAARDSWDRVERAIPGDSDRDGK